MDDYPRARPRYRVGSSPAPRTSSIPGGPVAPGATGKRIRISEKLERPKSKAASAPARSLNLPDNPLYKQQMGMYRGHRRWTIWFCCAASLAAIVPLLKISLQHVSGANPEGLLSVCLLAFNLMIWFGMTAYSSLLAEMFTLGMSKNLLRDIFLTAMRPAEIGEALMRARLDRIALLVLGLIPVECTISIFGYFLNPTPSRAVFAPLTLAYFLVDIYLIMTLNLSVGLRLMVGSRNRNEAYYKMQALHLLVYPSIFFAFMFLFWGASGLFSASFDESVFRIEVFKGQSVNWVGGWAICFLIIGRLLYLAIFRAGVSIRSQSIYRQNFEKWLRKNVIEGG